MRTPATASRTTRLVVWALLAAIVGVGTYLTTSGPAFEPAEPAYAAEQLTGDELVLALDGNHTTIGELNKYAWSNDSDEDFATIKLLPAWRWSNNTSLFTNFRSGIMDLDPFRGLASSIGSFTFGIAAWLWQGLLAVIAFALTTNIAALAGGAINRGFNGMFTSLLGSGIFAIVLVVGVFFVVKNVLKVRVGQAIRTIVTVLLPLGLLYGLAYTTDGADNDPLKPGTPAWIADRGVSMVDQVGVSIGSGFGLLNTANARLPEGETAYGLTDSCQAYTHELYGQYDRLAGADGGYSNSAYQALPASVRADMIAKAATSGSSRKLVSTVSLLWQRAYFGPWVTAQYGSPLGFNIACHQLETQNRIPAAEQMAIAGVVGGMPGAGADGAYRDYPGDAGKTQASYLAWVACDGPQRSELTAPFTKLELDGQCEAWWQDGTPPDGLSNNKMADVAEATIGSPEAEANRDEAEAFFQMYDSLTGNNPAQRMLGGVAALVTSAIYLWALGGIAVGSIIAQIGLVLLLILLPVTLTMLAVPSDKGQRNPMGIKMLKMTGGFFGAKLGLVVVMTLLMQSIVTMESLLNTSGRGAGSFLHMLIPLACVLLVRKLIKAAGFGDLTKLSGSLGLATQAALSAEGGGKMGRRMRTAQMERMAGKELGVGKNKFSLNSADAFAKRQANRVAKAPLGAAAGASRFGLNAATVIDHEKNGGKLTKLANRKAELWQSRKDSLLGARDEQGNLVEDGIWQRAQSFNGLVGLAAGGRGRSPLDVAVGEEVERQQQNPGMLAQIAGLDKGSANARTLQQQQAAMRAERRKALKDGKGQSVEEVDLRLAAKQLAGSAMHKNKLHQELLGEDFRDGDLDQEKRFLSKYKDHVGYGRGQVTAAGSMYAPFVTPTGKPGAIPAGETETATIRQGRHPVHYLPKEIADRRAGETDNDYTARINATMIRKGLMDAQTGETVDYAALHGVDLDSEYGQAQVLRASRGESSVLTDGSMTVMFSAAELADIDRTVSLMKLSDANKDVDRAAIAAGKVAAPRREIAIELTQERAAASEAHRTAAFELTRQLKLKGDELRGAAKAVDAPDPSADLQAAAARVQTLTVEVQQMTDRHGPDNGQTAQAKAALDQVRKELASLTSQQQARVDAQRQIDSLRNDIHAMLRIEVDESGKVADMGELAAHLTAGFKENKTIETYSVLMDPKLESGAKAKAAKGNDIDVLNYQQALKAFVDDKLRELDVADGQQILEVISSLTGKARQEAQKLNDGAVKAAGEWEKALFQDETLVQDRRLEAARVESDRASRPVSKIVRTRFGDPKGLPKLERKALESV